MKQGDKEEVRQALSLYFIMGSLNCWKSPEFVLQEAISGGITLFQFREKGEGALTGAAKWELAVRLKALCDQNNISFIVNDDIELALQLDAAGIHVGQDDEPLQQVRARCGNRMIGVSVHSLAQAEEAIQQGVDYLGIGPVFPTLTKKDVHPVQGTVLIQQLRDIGYTVPIVGIGGITADNVEQVIQSGADGAAVITAISHAEDRIAAAVRLKERI